MTADEVMAIKKDVLKKIDVSRQVSDDEVYDIIDESLRQWIRQVYVGISERLQLRRDIFNSIRRLDVLQDLIEDDSITEIMVNGPNKIFYERNGRLYLSDRAFESEKKLEDIVQRIASEVNRSVNEASPITDARLADGSRVNLVLPPVSLSGAVVTIRKFRRDIMSMEKLIEIGSVSREAAELLKRLVKGHYNIICSGGTGCGKSTMLNALSGYIQQEERVITIEDSAELIMDIPNLVRMEARNANVEGKKEITIRTLIKTALRMRPDRIIVGEVRGREAIDMLQSLNTGHCGMSTIHANSPKDMLSRLETMVLLDENIPLNAIRAQIASAVDIIIGISRLRDDTRRITEICEVEGFRDGEICLNKLFEFKEDDVENPESNVKEAEGYKSEEFVRKVSGRLVKVGDLIHKEKLISYRA